MITPIAHDDVTSDCDLYANFLNEDDLRNDPVFQVFLDKYTDAEFFNIILESSPPLGVSSFEYFRNSNDNSAIAKLDILTDECSIIQEYTLYYLGTHYFHTHSGFPYGHSNDSVILRSPDDIAISIYNMIFSDDVMTCDDPQTLHSNIRGEYVCINPESVSKLIDRGYLIIS